MVKVIEVVNNQDCSKVLSWDVAYVLRDRLQREALEAGEDLNVRRYGIRNL